MAGLIGGSLVTPLFTRRLHPASALAAGLALAAVGFGLITQASSVGLVAVATGSAVFGLGLAPVTNLVVGMVLGTAPPQWAGAASGLSETSTEFGGALGIAILGSVGAATYHLRVTGHLPRGIPGPAARAIDTTLGDATTAAGQLHGQSADEVLRVARAAFTSGVDVVAGVSAVIVVALAVVAMARLRQVTPSGEAAAAAATDPDQSPSEEGMRR
jgi:DHA2 family multidrug resistance protein-like MFS transporter